MTHHIGARLLVPALLVALAAAGCTADRPTAAGPVSSPAASPRPSPSPSRPAVTPSSRRPTPTYRQTRSTTLQRPLLKHPVNVDCRVTAATLNRALHPSSDYRIDPRTVQCWKGWATGYDPYWVSDGDDLFKYNQTTGWHFYGAGSAFECKDLGIKMDPRNPPPFCG